MTPNIQVSDSSMRKPTDDAGEDPISVQSQAGFELTPREKQCAVLTAMGLTEREIGSRLGISPNTIRVHIENIKRRCGASNKCHAIAMCILAGLIHLPSKVRADTIAARVNS